ncbi:MAG: glycosyltransferase family 4 protein [Anaerolineae bacterium]|nr:glycosyltransferase family 4 protein [Anaerolineae bacterium]
MTRPLKIALDVLGLGRPGGARTATLNLLIGLGELDPVNRYVAFLERWEPALERFANWEQRVAPCDKRLTMRAWAQARLPGILRRERFDLIHHNRSLGIFGSPCPTILTIYDVTILALPHFYPLIDVWYWRRVQPHVLARASRIVAISENTRRDLERYLSIAQEKVDVVHAAPDPCFRRLPDAGAAASVRARYGLPEHLILYVGLLARKKNIPTLLRAFGQLCRETDLPHALVATGRPFATSNDERRVRELLSELGITDRVHITGLIPQEDVVALYNAADLFAFPSLHEGFGLVPLEAMACGAPVVAANTSAIPEVVGDAAVLVDDPTDENELARAIVRVLTDSTLAHSMVQRGFEQARLFSRERSAREMLHIYRQVAGLTKR